MSDMAYFDESRYLPSPRRANDYKRIVANGRKLMKDKTLVIGGLARNIAPVLGRTMARIERTGSMFKDYRVAIFENDSRDNTAEQLKSWAKINPNVHILSETLHDPVNPGVRCLNRATRMAKYRNACREYIIEHWPDFDNAMIVDTDLPGGWSYDGIANTFGQELHWDFVGSNGIIYKEYNGVLDKPLYYDAWAFRWHESWSPVFARQINPRNWMRGEPMLHVNSCFGGLALYKMECMLAGKYDGTDCEHVPLHRSLAELGFDQGFLNPSQIVCY
jgi:hypothetical protein